MVIFSLLNPDSKVPFFDEAYRAGAMDGFAGFVKKKINDGEKPRNRGTGLNKTSYKSF